MIDWVTRTQVLFTGILVCGTLLEYFYSVSTWSTLRLRPDGSLYTPVQDLIRYESRHFPLGHSGDISAYQGGSNLMMGDVNARWHKLHEFESTRISEEEASRIPQLTVPIPGQPRQYIVALDVIHELHCVDLIRHRIYSDLYHDSGSNETSAYHAIMFQWEHMDHCVDNLRQALMCLPDITRLTLAPSTAHRLLVQVRSTNAEDEPVRMCRNFEEIREWAQGRNADKFDSRVYVENPLSESFKEFGS